MSKNLKMIYHQLRLMIICVLLIQIFCFINQLSTKAKLNLVSKNKLKNLIKKFLKRNKKRYLRKHKQILLIHYVSKVWISYKNEKLKIF